MGSSNHLLSGKEFLQGGVHMGLSAYFTKDGKLTHTLKLEDTQGGFVGFTGSARIIEPSGEWRIERVGPPQVVTAELLSEGKLTTNQLAALAHQLASLDLLNLPNELGSPPQANPHLKTISFGDKGTTWDTRKGLPPPEDPEAAAVARFIALELVIEFWTKAEEQGTP
jgi:hypothetical protein